MYFSRKHQKLSLKSVFLAKFSTFSTLRNLANIKTHTRVGGGLHKTKPGSHIRPLVTHKSSS